MLEILDLPIENIIVQERGRKSNGSLDPLERSIDRYGVMQPIGVTADYTLIFGARRLQASKNIGKATIPARVFDIESDDLYQLLNMEQAENDIRLDLTPSEKTALAMRIEQSYGERRGGDHGNQHTGGKRPDLVFCQNEARSDEIAAQAVGMKRETYRQAKAVVNSGNDDLVQQIDSGEKSINAAYKEIAPKKAAPRTFSISLRKNPVDDARALIAKAGSEYCTKLACELLQQSGHVVNDLGEEGESQ